MSYMATSQYPNLRLYPDAFQLYAERSGRLRTEATRKAVRSQLSRLQRQYPGKRLKDFTAADLAAYCLAGDPAPNTQRVRRSGVQSFYSWAVFAGLVKDDPSRDLKFLVHPGTHTVKRHTWLTPDEFRHLLREMPTESLMQRRDRILIFVGAMVGLRLATLAALRWSDFTPALTSVKVKVKRQKLLEFGIPDLLLHELEIWRKELAPDQGPDGPLFPAFHNHLNAEARYVTECVFDRAIQESGIFGVVGRVTEAVVGIKMRPHDLRRSFAAFLESEGFDVQDIQRALGHENLATTSIYLDKNPNKAVQVGRSLNVRL